MKKMLLAGAATVTLLFSGITSASANDIVDFLRAVNGMSHPGADHRRHDHKAHGHSSHARVNQSAHDHRTHSQLHYGLSTRDVARRHAALEAAAVRSQYGIYRTSPAITLGVRLSSDRRLRDNSSLYGRPYLPVGSYRQDVYPSVYDSPVTSVPSTPIVIPQDFGTPYPGDRIDRFQPAPGVSPVLPPAVHMPHKYGEIVDCLVPLYPRVKVEDPENIAPHAVPVVVAVRDPNLCDHKCDCCVPRCVYVEVCVPDCPPRGIRVSDCGTELKMDFGKYEVEITSRKGCIEIDYDD